MTTIGRNWYATSCVVLVLCFITIATLWANLVPVFESPDEPAHFDYAFSLASAGRLFRVADGRADFDPRVKTLMRATDLSRLAFNFNERVRRSYEDRTYRKRIETENERYRSYSPLNPKAVRTPLASVYPFVPYVLYALAAYPFKADVISALYACRYASIAFSAIGLFAWSRILRRLHVCKLHAMTLVAVAAFFPLTSFVGSYVQPDGVAFLIVSILLLITLRIRDGYADRTHGIAYGFLLSLLYGTKLQYALALAIATIVPIAIAFYRYRTSKRTCVIIAGTTVAGLAIVQYVTTWVMRGANTATYFQGRRTLTSALTDHISSGAPAYLLDEFQKAIADIFGGGYSTRSFWGYFGWLDAPILIVNYRITDAFTFGEVVATAVVATLLGFSLVVGVKRLLRVARRRSSLLALRIASNDPAFNAFVLFGMLIVALYISSANLFGAQGRNWYAFEVVAFATGSWYCTKNYFRAARRPLTLVVLATLGMYSSIASVSAFSTIDDRYYRQLASTHHPDYARLLELNAPGSVTIDGVDRTSERFTMHGWAYDQFAIAPCWAAYATVDGNFLHWISYGITREDVGRDFGRFDLARTGFSDTINVPDLGHGRHMLGFTCVSASATRRFRTTAVGEVTLAR